MTDVLPCAECRGCCCTFAPMTMGEFKAIRRTHGVPKGATLLPMKFRDGSLPGVPAGSPGVAVIAAGSLDGTCAYLTAAGRCSVHAIRPRGCRAYGVIEELPCAYLHPVEAERAARGLLRELIPVGDLLADGGRAARRDPRLA